MDGLIYLFALLTPGVISVSVAYLHLSTKRAPVKEPPQFNRWETALGWVMFFPTYLRIKWTFWNLGRKLR